MSFFSLKLRRQFVSICRKIAEERSPETDSPGRILVIGSMGIGDMVFFLPVLISLRRSFSRAKIHIVTHRYCANVSLLNKLGLVDSVEYFEPFIKSLIRSIKRQDRYDLLVAEHHIPSIALVPWLYRIPTRLGIVSGGGFQLDFDELFNRKVPCREHEHTSDRCRRLLDELGIEQPQCPFDEIEAIKPAASGKLGSVILHPGSSETQVWKRWPSEKFLELTSRLSGESVIVIGSRSEKLGLAKRFGDCAEVFVSDDLAKTIEFLAGAKVLVGNDSGMIHLSSLLGVPTVGLFGPTDENLTGLLGPHTRQVVAECDHRPCYRAFSLDRTERCRERGCMNKIEVEDVVRAIRDLA